MIKSIEESEEDVQEPEEENTQEDLQSINSMTHALADHANPQAAKVEESLKQQPVTILIETRSTNNFINSKVAAQLMLQDEDCSMFDIEVADGQILKYDRRCPRKSHRKWKFIKDDSALIYPPDTQVDEEAQVQLMIAWDHRIVTHHRLVTTSNVGPQEQDAPTIGAMREPPKELQIRTWRHGAQP
ncbi:hypothetical protein BHE74_00051506 [Ensete ventricosum]|nr:hypothetical protein BHE74_00051506 [Ensete ventricosum]